jgi:dTDP-4-dehydrorhamnose reductase
MLWAVTGSRGQLGYDLLAQIPALRTGLEVLALSRESLDLSNTGVVRSRVLEIRPDVIINCAAATDVDAAEGEDVHAKRVNAQGPAALARALKESGRGLLVQVSTDYVFGDSGLGPHAEDEPPAPGCAYGHSKWAGEVAVRSELRDRGLVVRTAWLYGAHGINFVKTIARKALAGESLKVVSDQLGQPSWSRDVASRIVALVEGFHTGAVPAGTYHAVNSGSATWFEFAKEIVRLLDQDPELVSPISSDQLDRAARRPVDSRLGDAAAQACGLPPMRDWREALAEALPQIVRNL